MSEAIKQNIPGIAEILKVLGHELRLNLMQAMMCEGEKSVGELEELTGITQPGLSQQLAILRKAKLVQTRRESKMVFYRIIPESLAVTARFMDLLANLTPTGETRGKEATDQPTQPKAASSSAPAASFARIL